MNDCYDHTDPIRNVFSNIKCCVCENNNSQQSLTEVGDYEFEFVLHWLCWISFVGWDVTLRQVITRTEGEIFQHAYCKLSVKLGETVF